MQHSVLFNFSRACKEIHTLNWIVYKYIFSSLNGCLFFSSAKDWEEVEEEVDDVQVKVEGGKDVLLGAEGVLVVAAEHDLGVVDDVQREDNGTHRGVTNLGVAEMLKCHCQCLLNSKIVHFTAMKG